MTSRDTTFSAFVPTSEDLKGLTELKKFVYNDEIHKCVTKINYFCKPLNDYRIIAGWNIGSNNPDFNELKYEGRYKDIEFEDLGDYLGATIIYRDDAENFSGKPSKRVSYGILAKFKDNKRSSGCIVIVGTEVLRLNQRSSWSNPTNKDHIGWLAVVAYAPFPKPVISNESSVLSFEVSDASKLLVCDPNNEIALKKNGLVISSVKKGTWNVKLQNPTKTNDMLVAVHSSFENDPVSSTWVFDNNDFPYNGKPKMNIGGNEVHSLRDQSTWTHVCCGDARTTSGRVGIFDASHYFDESIFPQRRANKTGWDKYFTFDFAHWDVVSLAIDEIPNAGHPIAIPFGIFSGERSHYVERRYACFLKVISDIKWTPPTHSQFPRKTKEAIICTLLVARRQRWPLDQHLIYKILSYVAFDKNHVEIVAVNVVCTIVDDYN